MRKRSLSAVIDPSGVFTPLSSPFNKRALLRTLTRMEEIQLFGGLRPLNLKAVLRDVVAGVTLASMDIPQVLGYARIAGMPAVTGLYTVFLPLLAFAFFGASRHLVVAADSATADIFASQLSTMAPIASGEYVALAGMVALLDRRAAVRGAGLQARLSRRLPVAHRAGRLSRRRRRAGRDRDAGRHARHRRVHLRAAPVSLGRSYATWRKSTLPTLAISALVVASILARKRFLPRLPVPLFAVVAGIAASYIYQFSRARHCDPRAGRGWAAAVAAASRHLAADARSAAGRRLVFRHDRRAKRRRGRVFAERYHEDVDAERRHSRAWPPPTRRRRFPALRRQRQPDPDRHGRSRRRAQPVRTGGVCGVVVVVLLFFSQFLQYLPHCVLASIVFTIAIGLINVKSLLAIRRESPGEFTLAVFTAAAVVVHRRRAWHSDGGCAVAAAPCAPQLPAAHHDAGAGAKGAGCRCPPRPARRPRRG